ncbi:Mn-containing catalase [Xanthomonas sacchari]|nr:Mn-containing catalase [Xanthomonas sacchari]
MFMHNKRLMYTVRVARPDPALASLMLEQFGGPQGELAAAMRYFTQAIGEVDPGRKDLLYDIATEELSHLEIIGSIIAMLNQGPKAVLSEGMAEAEEMRNLTLNNTTSQTQQILYGGGPALVNSSGVPWSAAYVDSIGEPTADLRSNIAAEARAKIVYERLINVTDDPGHRRCADLPDDPRSGAPEILREGAVRDRAELPAGQVAGRSRLHRPLLRHVAGRRRHARAVE